MALTINTNVMSLNAQRNLSTVRRTSSRRPCSACRPACASTARRTTPPASRSRDRFTSQINGLNQAARNANDGISLAQTAEGALGAVSEQPAAHPRAGGAVGQRDEQRHRTAPRSTPKCSSSSRKSTASRTQTSFNGVKLLDGTFTSAELPGRRERRRDDLGQPRSRARVRQRSASSTRPL